MPESTEWELPITIRRRPSERTKGYIAEPELHQLWDELVHRAYELGFTISGVPKPKSENCPSCGKIIRCPIMPTICPYCQAKLTR